MKPVVFVTLVALGCGSTQVQPQEGTLSNSEDNDSSQEDLDRIERLEAAFTQLRADLQEVRAFATEQSASRRGRLWQCSLHSPLSSYTRWRHGIATCFVMVRDDL